MTAPMIDTVVVAEADGNRTRLTGIPGHYGFEDRARHQTRNASTTNCIGHSRRK
jgi:hypothetical protein